MTTERQATRAEHRATIRQALVTLYDWLPPEQNKIASGEHDKAIRYAKSKHKAAVRALRELVRLDG